VVHRLTERLEPGAHRAQRLAETHDLDRLAEPDAALFDDAGDHRAAAGDGQHVLDRHQERPVQDPWRNRDVGVDRVQQVTDPGRPVRVTFESSQAGDPDHRDLVAGETVAGQQFTDLKLDQVEQFGVLDHVGLVQRDDDVADPDLPGQHDMLPGLWHRAVLGGHDQDRTVDLARPGDHVLQLRRSRFRPESLGT
jgi:hypothetical protein